MYDYINQRIIQLFYLNPQIIITMPETYMLYAQKYANLFVTQIKCSIIREV